MLDKKKRSAKTLEKAIRFRPIQERDMPFLQTVYASTRVDIQGAIGLMQEHKDMFIQQQFQAQHFHYQQHYKGANFDLVLFKKKPIGRLYIDRRKTEIRIVDITLLPDYQNKGIGGFLLKNVLEEGKERNKIVSLHVKQDNPALRLYERLGFRKKEEVGDRFLLEVF